MNEGQQIRLLLSGGIGAGKSAVGRILVEGGIPVIHTDQIGHSVLEPEGEAFDAVSSRWPQVVVEDRIDRTRLAAIVFAETAALDELEAITHPAIAARVFSELEGSADQPLVVVEIPHLNDLLGNGWLRVVVVAPTDTRARRLVERGMEAADVRARMAAQPSDEQWKEAADFIVDNSGDIDQLEPEVDRVVEAIAG